MVFEKMIKKNAKPKSATFWIGLVPIIGGIVEIVDKFTPLGMFADLAYAAFQDTSPFMLIMMGAGTITMRASIPTVGSMK